MQTRISARPRRFHAHLFPTILVISLVPALSSGGLPARSPVANDGLRNQTANSQLNSEVVTAGISANQARNENPQVHPVNSRPYGLSYAEWSARWWQWIYQIPLSVNPNFDTTGEDCAQGQSGHVWFLAGSFGAASILRTCPVPVGTSLFFPILNVPFGSGVGDCETPVIADFPCTDYTFGPIKGVPALRAAAAAVMDNPALNASVDGVPLTSLTAYRAQSPVFGYYVPSDNILDVLLGVTIPAGTRQPVVSDGYWIMLHPLSAGAHTTTFEGRTASGFSTGVITYNLSVNPGRK